ncbi:uncharacterized protein J4E92_001029 [Alternaria infectoria]|uniref:uncharacterized protein n=1 Tax=Alternaria infectoria TaxID=45303 RepID=UPI00221F4C90|nr:uncharacterized protein J4E92_001029 [Alternaria infectoria]KAI4939743.1 hypothetical protein J4E92_001029 [Alternaria infectoria]
MPDRPSRFRPPIQDLDVVDSAGPFSGLHRDVSIREPGREPAILPSGSSAEAEVIGTNLCEEAAATDKPLDTNIEEDRSVLVGLANAPSVYEIPRSSPPDLRLASVSGGTQGLRNGLSSTRKRRLPVHELALLRTTTLDGLPLPGDVTLDVAAPIAVVDPIEDSQIRLTNTLHISTSGGVIITKSRLIPKTTQPPDSVGRPKTEPMAMRTEPLERPTQLPANMQRYCPNLRDAFDGFVGSELKLVPKKSVNRQRIANPTKRQKPGIKRELVLRAGSPPLLAGWATTTANALVVGKTPMIVGANTSSRLENAQTHVGLGQLTLTRCQNVLQAGTDDGHAPELGDETLYEEAHEEDRDNDVTAETGHYQLNRVPTS